MGKKCIPPNYHKCVVYIKQLTCIVYGISSLSLPQVAQGSYGIYTTLPSPIIRQGTRLIYDVQHGILPNGSSKATSQLNQRQPVNYRSSKYAYNLRNIIGIYLENDQISRNVIYPYYAHQNLKIQIIIRIENRNKYCQMCHSNG